MPPPPPGSITPVPSACAERFCARSERLRARGG